MRNKPDFKKFLSGILSILIIAQALLITSPRIAMGVEEIPLTQSNTLNTQTSNSTNSTTSTSNPESTQAKDKSGTQIESTQATETISTNTSIKETTEQPVDEISTSNTVPSTSTLKSDSVSRNELDEAIKLEVSLKNGIIVSVEGIRSDFTKEKGKLSLKVKELDPKDSKDKLEIDTNTEKMSEYLPENENNILHLDVEIQLEGNKIEPLNSVKFTLSNLQIPDEVLDQVKIIHINEEINKVEIKEVQVTDAGTIEADFNNFSPVSVVWPRNPELFKTSVTDWHHYSSGSLGAKDNSKDPNLGYTSAVFGNKKLLPGEVVTSKVATPVIGKVNTWDITVRFEGRDNINPTTDVVLVIDNSSSMYGNTTRMIETKKAAKNFIQTSLSQNSNLRIAIVSFTDYVNIESGDITQPFISDINSLNTSVDNITKVTDTTNFGGTFTQAGLLQANELIKGSSADNKYIILLSDGVPTYSYDLQSTSWSTRTYDYNTGRYNTKPIDDYVFNTNNPTSGIQFDYTNRVGLGTDINSSYDAYYGRRYTYNTYDVSRQVYTKETTYNRYFDDYYYSNSRATILEAQRIKAQASSTGLDGIYTIGVELNYYDTNYNSAYKLKEQAEGVLSSIATDTDHFINTTDSTKLTKIFSDIAGTLDNRHLAMRDASLIDKMGAGFEIVNIGSITTSTGTATYDQTTDTINWNIGDVSTPIAPGKDVRYAEIKYQIEITPEMLDQPNAKTNDHALFPTNAITDLAYTNIKDLKETKNIPSPKVDPVLLKVKKVLLDYDSNKILNDLRAFDINVSNGKTFNSTYNVNSNVDYQWYTTLRDEGTYTVKETGVTGNPESTLSDFITTYKIDGVETSTFLVNHNTSVTPKIPRGDVNIEVTNKVKDFLFTFTKVDKEGNPINGAEFILTNKETGTIYPDIDPSLSVFTYKNLPLGTYTLKESKAPDGYGLIETIYEIVVSKNSETNKTEIKVTNPDGYFDVTKNQMLNLKVGLGKFVINKVDEENSPLGGAVFRLTDSTGKTIEGTSDVNTGKIVFSELKEGVYTLEEISAPVGYDLSTEKWTVTVDIEGNVKITSEEGSTSTITNFSNQGVLLESTANSSGGIQGIGASIIINPGLSSSNGAYTIEQTATLDPSNPNTIHVSGTISSTLKDEQQVVILLEQTLKTSYRYGDKAFYEARIKEIINSISAPNTKFTLITFGEVNPIQTVFRGNSSSDALINVSKLTESGNDYWRSNMDDAYLAAYNYLNQFPNSDKTLIHISGYTIRDYDVSSDYIFRNVKDSGAITGLKNIGTKMHVIVETWPKLSTYYYDPYRTTNSYGEWYDSKNIHLLATGNYYYVNEVNNSITTTDMISRYKTAIQSIAANVSSQKSKTTFAVGSTFLPISNLTGLVNNNGTLSYENYITVSNPVNYSYDLTINGTLDKVPLYSAATLTSGTNTINLSIPMVSIQNTMSLKVIKQWKSLDPNNQTPNTYPIEVYLQGREINGTIKEYGPITLSGTESPPWTGLFSDLPVMDASGNKITYTLMEKLPTDSQGKISSDYDVKYVYSDLGGTIINTQLSNVTIQNKKEIKKVDLTIKKVDSEDKALGLANAVFDLYTTVLPKGTISTDLKTIEYEGSTYYLIRSGITTGADGLARIDSIELYDGSKYLLIETTAPENYSLGNVKIPFTYDATSTLTLESNLGGLVSINEEGQLEIKNYQIYNLPSSGGPGTLGFTFIGTFVLTILLYYKRKSRILKS